LALVGNDQFKGTRAIGILDLASITARAQVLQIKLTPVGQLGDDLVAVKRQP